MPNTIRPPSAVTTVMAASAAALGVLSVGLLSIGTVTHHVPLLAWGCVLVLLTVGLGGLAAIRSLIDAAIDSCVARIYKGLQVEVENAVTSTAVKVGQAIAEGLAEGDDPRPPAPRTDRVSSLY